MKNRNTIIAATIAVGLAVAAVTVDGFWSGVAGVAILAVLVGSYFAPSIVAGVRKHHNTGAIAALNGLLGWTVFGWIGALVWALTEPAPVMYRDQAAYRQ